MTLHYDYHVRWKYFRGFRDTGWVRIAPLTIVIGANNAGKSSLLAPLILMQQTAQSKDPNTPLVTRGSSTDIGFYRDYSYLHDVDKDIDFSFRFHTHDRTKGERLKEIGTYPPGVFSSKFTHNASGKDLKLKSYEVFDIYSRKMFKIIHDDAGYFIESPNLGEMTDSEKMAISQSKPVNFLFSSSSVLYHLRKSQDKSNDEAVKFENFSAPFVKYVQISSYAYEDIRRQFSNFYYIGPNRETPKRAYDYFGDEPEGVGKAGEHFAEMLKNNNDNILTNANRWLKRMGIGKSIEIDDLSNNMFSVNLLSMNGKDRNNISDLGYGISQVLPVIVQLLAAEKSSLTIVEQPELHLNPKLQRNIADILVDRASNGRRVAIETHSEHILLRIRTLIAAKKISPADVALYFVERKGQKSIVRKIEIDELGHIESQEWPKDFFSDKFNGAMELATAQRQAKSVK
jgi:predicted ATPase